jgi:hypothetical protein
MYFAYFLDLLVGSSSFITHSFMASLINTFLTPYIYVFDYDAQGGVTFGRLKIKKQ